MSESRQSVSEERVLKLLEVYGGDFRVWPTEEVEGALNCITHSPALQQAQREALYLDGLLAADRDALRVDTKQVDRLATRILARLPADDTAGAGTGSNPLQRLCLVFRPPGRAAVFLSAAAVLILAVVLLHPAVDSEDALFNAFEQWAWQDITGQALTLDDQEPALDFMGLVELESAADDV